MRRRLQQDMSSTTPRGGSTGPRQMSTALLVAVVLLAAGCSDDPFGDETSAPTSTVATGATTSTTEPDSATTTSSTGPGEPVAAVCDVLAGAAPAPVEDEGPPVVLGRGTVGDVVPLFAVPSDVIVYLDPGTDDSVLEDLAADARELPEVRSVETTGQAASLAEFRNLFADQSNMIDAIDDASQLPTRLSIRLRNLDDAAAVESWARDQTGVYEIRIGSGDERIGAILDQLFRTDAQRERWREIAGELRGLDVAWGTDAGEVVDEMMETGSNGAGTDDGESRLITVIDGVNEAVAACG